MAPSLPESFKSQVSSEHKSRNSFVFTEVQTTTFNSGCSEDTVKKATRNNSGYEENARGVTEAEPPKKKLGRSRGRARKYVDTHGDIGAKNFDIKL